MGEFVEIKRVGSRLAERRKAESQFSARFMSFLSGEWK
jgi:hypothetical protein